MLNNRVETLEAQLSQLLAVQLPAENGTAASCYSPQVGHSQPQPTSPHDLNTMSDISEEDSLLTTAQRVTALQAMACERRNHDHVVAAWKSWSKQLAIVFLLEYETNEVDGSRALVPGV